MPMDELKGSPYVLDDEAAQGLRKAIQALEERCRNLRALGTLTEETLSAYYGRKRFEQVAESNALEGSTLSVGETELAIMKGVTLTGHDPAYVRDARNLARALDRLVELAREKRPTNFEDVHEIHALILGDRPGAGVFRNEPVRIAGAAHHPPPDWEGVMSGMEDWQRWSLGNADLPPALRAIVLHAWLTHVHPYLDGNGRLARAIGNLELIRGGYPPIIIPRSQREHYLRALAESDEGGDIRSFAELVLGRLEGALLGLERSAETRQGYDPLAETQTRLLRIWNSSVLLLAESLRNEIGEKIEKAGGKLRSHLYSERADPEGYAQFLDLEAYRLLCQGRSAPRSWAFALRIDVPGFLPYERLVWAGYRSRVLRDHMRRTTGTENGPSLYWSSTNPEGYPRWQYDRDPPYAKEMTIREGRGDEWHVLLPDGTPEILSTSDLGRRIAQAIVTAIRKQALSA
jgi:Fic family protein